MDNAKETILYYEVGRQHLEPLRVQFLNQENKSLEFAGHRFIDLDLDNRSNEEDQESKCRIA